MQTFSATDGVEIGHQVFGGAGARPPVVLHHGFVRTLILGAVLPMTACATPMDVESGFAGAGTGGAPPSTGAPPRTGAPPSTGAPTQSAWCRVRSVLHEHCTSCHGAEPLFGAPVSLVTASDLRSRSSTRPDAYVYELVKERMRDSRRPMPPATIATRPTAADVAAIETWIAEGASADDAACTGDAGPRGPRGGGEGDAGSSRGGALDGSTGADRGDGAPSPDWAPDCEQRYKFVAHGQSVPNDPTKFDVSASLQKQFYQCFFFKVPWGSDSVQALEFRPIIDDARVIHHWILFGGDAGLVQDGQVGGLCSNGAFLAGWAPGENQTDAMPPDVGLQMPRGPNAYLGLEIHYSNPAAYPNVLDGSGVELCVTRTFRRHTASVHWLGSTNITLPPRQSKTVTSTCDPIGTQPVQLLAISPHMHQLGTHARLVLNRANGTQQVLRDLPFDFAHQKSYPINVVVNDGETLTTTCTYNNTTNVPVFFGPNTENEMCYVLATAYPAGGLSGLLGNNNCTTPL